MRDCSMALRIGLLATLLLAGVAAAQDDTVLATAYGTLNVRSGPGAQFAVIDQLIAGEQLPVDGRTADGAWLRVRLPDGQIGWLPVFAVIIDGAPETLPPVTAPDQTEANGVVVVTAYGVVNVRGGPGMDYPIIGQMDAGLSAAAVGRDSPHNDWLLVEYNGLMGWVAYFAVAVTGSPDTLPVLAVDGSSEAIVPPEDVALAYFNIRLRASPTRDAPELLVVPYGSRVTLVGRSAAGDWLYVIYQDTVGWGWGAFFDVTPERLQTLPVYDSAVVETTPEPTPAG